MATTYIIRTFGGVFPVTLNTTPVVPQSPNATFYVRSGSNGLAIRGGSASLAVRSGSSAVEVRGA